MPTMTPEEFTRKHPARYYVGAVLLLLLPNRLLGRIVDPLERWVWGQRITES